VGVAKTGLFIVLVGGAYWLVEYWAGLTPRARRVVSGVVAALRGKETVFALTVVFVLLFATLSDAVGLHFVAGTFFGGMLLSQRAIGRRNFDAVQKTASAIAMGFLAPVFFALVGLQFQVSALASLGFAAAVLATGFVGKLLGGYVGAAAAGLDSRDRRIVAFGLNGRGVMDLVIATIALENGFIEPPLFSVLVLTAIVGAVLTPLLLRRAYGGPELPDKTAVN
jgi:Kef-type K+ transport system membrane component KefB